MPRAPAPIYLDEDVSVIVAAILKARGFEVATANPMRGSSLPGGVHPGIWLQRWGRLLTRLAAEDLKNQLLYV